MSILLPYFRGNTAIDKLLPWLYLKGISTGNFADVLHMLLGPDAEGLSPNVIVRLKDQWSQEDDDWSRCDLTQNRYIYVSADRIYVNAWLEDTKNRHHCLLVLTGTTSDGRKDLIAVVDGYRESEFTV